MEKPMTSETVPAKSEVIEPITSSADGKRNSYSFHCLHIGQSMSYAACLWRQEVLGAPKVKTPEDWAGCDQARRCGTCPALTMRNEEIAAGKSIYFEARDAWRRAASQVRQWVGPSRLATAVKAVSDFVSPPPKKKEADMLDAIGDMGSFADVVTEAAKPVAPIPVAIAGESPLQMARRIATERANGNV
jgi:hypothetical protein